MSIRTFEDLTARLEAEAAWRRREIVTMGFLHDAQRRPHEQELLRRFSVVALYAHWEGFVKQAGTAYVEFVASRRLRNRDLKPGFVALGFKESLATLRDGGAGASLAETVERLLDSLDRTADFAWKKAVRTRSNLNPKVLRDILTVLGLDGTTFRPREIPVIKELADRRHEIAHGERRTIDAEQFAMLRPAVLRLIEDFQSLVETAAANGHFRSGGGGAS